MNLSAGEQHQLVKLFNKKYGFPLDHTSLTHNYWTVATWKEDSVPFLNESPHMISELDKLWSEIANTDRNTVVRPLNAELVTPHGHLLSVEDRIDNLLTNNGMKDMAQNRTGESSLGTSHVAVGDSNATETINDTVLGNELDRKVWSEKVTVDQTERYAASFVRSDFTSDVILREAGGFTASSGVILVFRVTFADKSISAGQIMTTQVSVTHQNGVII